MLNDEHITKTPLREIPRRVSAGASVAIEAGWPVCAEYDNNGKLRRFLNRDTLEPLPKYGPLEPQERMLHRLADVEDASRCSVVYFIGRADTAIKIGFSVDVKGRFAAIQSCSPIPLEILATCQGAQSKEVAYHFQFAEHRLHGEWFSPHPDILAEIARLTPHSSNPMPSLQREIGACDE